MTAANIALDHVVLEVPDPERSVAFYQAVLGLEPVRLEEYRAGAAPFPSARVDAGTVLDFFPPRMWRGAIAANPNHLCFTMGRAAIQALEERLVASAVAIARRDPHNYGARGYGHALYFNDPDGITLEARFYEDA
jgi:catechol 2,3-dioxygenase-like lactoylglutathione lyase family enzyme